MKRAAPRRTPRTGRGSLQTGNPGNKGGTGRPSKAFLDSCIRAVEDDELWALARAKDPLGLLKLAAAYAFGPPTQQVQAEGSFTIHVVFDDPPTGQSHAL